MINLGNNTVVKHTLYTFLLLILPTLLFAQSKEERIYTVRYNNELVSDVIKDLEDKGNIKIYYKQEDILSLRVSLTLENALLKDILNRLSKEIAINYLIKENNVFLTKEVELNDRLLFDNEVEYTSNEVKTAEQNVQDANIFNKIYEIGVKSNAQKNGTATLSGYLRDEITKTPIAGASIATADRKIIGVSDADGFYTLNLPLGLNLLIINASDNRNAKRRIILYNNGRLNIEVKESIEMLKEIRILATRTSTLKNLEMGVNKLNIKAIKQVPTVFGEPDVLRVVLTLPGVQSVGEASTGFNVRGGSADQNLILLDNSTIYNPSHFFGFFSAFNPDIVKDVQLYKSTIPEKFGGRLSSVLEVTNREGDKSKFTGTAGIGLITSRFNIEGPIDSGRTSFIFGGRATYSNWLMDLLPDEYKNSKASFYDFNLGISHQFNRNNSVNITGYHSKDNFKLNSDTTYNYSNKNAAIEWKKTFNIKLNGTFKFAMDRYDYDIQSEGNPINSYKLKFRINQTNVKTEFRYTLDNNHLLNFGFSSTLYQLNPGALVPLDGESLIAENILEKEKALETAIFLGDEYKISEKLSAALGIRYAIYNYLGPKSINIYAPNQPKLEVNILEQKTYGNNELIKTYHAPEIRLAGRYNIVDDLSIKASYNSLRQYIHLLSNTTAISPTDVWKLSDPNIKPQAGWQIALGLYKNFSSKAIETSIEGYYKNLKNYLDYKSGANLVLNKNIEQDVIATTGKAYGIELFVKKNTGKLNGWVSYTYSRILLKMDDLNVGNLVNGGKYYPANYDKPHAFNFTGNYKVKQRYHFSLNFTYSTGRPITLPIAKYYYAGGERVYYSDRNAYRIPDYLRTDISFNIEGNHKLKQLTHNSWTLGVYNVTGRKNPFSTYFTQENGVINGYNLSIFASPIPFINYNIRF